MAEALLDAAQPAEGSGAPAVDVEQFGEIVGDALKRWATHFPGAGYGGRFMRWMLTDSKTPTGSFGNGSAMRVSACGWAARTLPEALVLAELSALPTHNHPEGVAGAQAAAWLIFRLREGASREALTSEWNGLWGGCLGTLSDLAELEASRPIPSDLRSSATLPVAAALVLGSRSYLETVQRAVALGGDCDTIGAIAGAAAGAAFGVPVHLKVKKADPLLPEEIKAVCRRFNAAFGANDPRRPRH